MNTKPFFTNVSWYANLLEPAQSEFQKKIKPDGQHDASVNAWDEFSEPDALWPEHPKPDYRRERKGSQKDANRKKYR